MMNATMKQRGVALITALVVLAIASTIAAAMIWQGGLDERRTATLIQGNQAMEYALGAESWAEQIMLRDFTDPKVTTQSVNLGQDWAQQLPPLPVEGGQIVGHIEDMQGRFNLDLLQSQGGAASQAYMAQFQRLLQSLNIDPGIAQAVADWINTGNNPTQPYGAKDDYYSRLQPPYLTAEAPMTSVSELELVRGMTPQIYAALLPYVCAIPVTAVTAGQGGSSSTSTGWALNINTASPLMLMSLAQNVSEDQVQSIVAARAAQGITQSELSSLNINLNSQGASSPPTGFTSNYFLLTVTAEIGSTRVTMYSLLHYTGGLGGQVTAVRRTFGTL